MSQNWKNGKVVDKLERGAQTKSVKMTNGGRVVQVDWEVIENTVQSPVEHWSWMSKAQRKARLLATL